MNILRSRNHHVARYHSLLVNIARIAGACIGNSGLKKERCARETRVSVHSRVSPSRPPVLSCAQILSRACYTGYVQYGLFNRDDVVDNNRQQSISIELLADPPWIFAALLETRCLKKLGRSMLRGKKLVLSFPAPYTSVLFCVLFPVSRGFSRLRQRKNLLTGYIHTS